MADVFDHDALTGITSYFDYDPVKDCVVMTYSQDVTGFLDRMKAIRNNPDISAKGIKEDWWLYCSIPPVVEMELRKKGLRLERSEDHKAILKEINTNYPFLRATEKKHA